MWDVNQTLDEHLTLAQEYFARDKIGYRVECAMHLRTYFEKRIAGESTTTTNNVAANQHIDKANDQLAGILLVALGESLDQAHCELGLVK